MSPTITIDQTTEKSQLILQLVKFAKNRAVSEIYISTDGIPSFLNTVIGFNVFLSSLRTYPHGIYWTSQFLEIYDYLYSVNLNLITFQTYEEIHHVEPEKTLESKRLEKEIVKTLESPDQPPLLTHSKSETEPDKIDPQPEPVKYTPKIESENIDSYNNPNPNQDFEPVSDLEIQPENSEISAPKKIQDLDSLINRLEKTKSDLSKKGKYPIKNFQNNQNSGKNGENNSGDNWERWLPLSSVSNSIFFLIAFIIMCFAILLRAFPL